MNLKPKSQQYEAHFCANVQLAIEHCPDLSPQKVAFIRSLLGSPIKLYEAHAIAREIGCGLEMLLPEIQRSGG